MNTTSPATMASDRSPVLPSFSSRCCISSLIIELVQTAVASSGSHESRSVAQRDCLAANLNTAKGDDEIKKMAEAIMDEVVNRLLNEAAEVVLRED